MYTQTHTRTHSHLVPSAPWPSASLPHPETVMAWLQVKPLVASWWHYELGVLVWSQVTGFGTSLWPWLLPSRPSGSWKWDSPVGEFNGGEKRWRMVGPSGEGRGEGLAP